jgi:pyrimidine deaminase RibD-like protein
MDIKELLDHGYFRLARNVSRLSEHPVKVGCVIARKKPLIACCNKVITHPRLFPGAISIHAEVRAIDNCQSDNLDGCTAYVYRETANGDPALARPCPHCMLELHKAGIKKVFYTVNEYPFYSWERI